MSRAQRAISQLQAEVEKLDQTTSNIIDENNRRTKEIQVRNPIFCVYFVAIRLQITIFTPPLLFQDIHSEIEVINTEKKGKEKRKRNCPS